MASPYHQHQPGETKPVQILKMAPAGFTGRPTPIIIKTTNPAAAGAQQTILVASAARAPPEAPAREEAPPTLYATNMSAVHYIDTGGEVYVTSGDTGYSEAAGYQPQPMAYAVTVSSGNYYAGPGGGTSATPQTQAVAPPLFGGQAGGGAGGGQYMTGGVPHVVGSSVTIPGGARGSQHRGRRSGARISEEEFDEDEDPDGMYDAQIKPDPDGGGGRYLGIAGPMAIQQAQHATRASPVTVQWLIDNYETAEGVSLPRATLYAHYLRHCHEQRLDPMNPASFGKLIRSVFLGLRTRRLGTRGNSKYHYYGIRIKSSSPLNHVSEDALQMPQLGSRHFAAAYGYAAGAGYAHGAPVYPPSQQQQQQQQQQQAYAAYGAPAAAARGAKGGAVSKVGTPPAAKPAGDAKPVTEGAAGAGPAAAGAGQASAEGDARFLGDVLGELQRLHELRVELDERSSPEELRRLGELGLSLRDVRAFESSYVEHCQEIHDALKRLEFSAVSTIWTRFWAVSAEQNRAPKPDELAAAEAEPAGRAGGVRLARLCQLPEVVRFVRAVDYRFYQALVRLLIPDLLRPIPSGLTQSIRNFAKSLEGWMKSALSQSSPAPEKENDLALPAADAETSGRAANVGVPAATRGAKLQVLSVFAQLLRRYTSLNHLAQAARAVLANSQQINQMLADLTRIDFHHIQEQANWVCQCADEYVSEMAQAFRHALQAERSLEHWAQWLDELLGDHLARFSAAAPADDTSAGPKLLAQGTVRYIKHARLFLLKWSYFSSLVIRDLTLRSAASFGSFHLIRLLLDEYLFYALELRLAARTGSTLLEVMYELRPQIGNGLADEDPFDSDRTRPDAFHDGVREMLCSDQPMTAVELEEEQEEERELDEETKVAVAPGALRAHVSASAASASAAGGPSSAKQPRLDVGYSPINGVQAQQQAVDEREQEAAIASINSS